MKLQKAWKQRTILLCLGIILAVSPVVYAGVGNLEIRAEMELLAGVLAQTTWIEQNGPQNGGNEYYQALQAFFAPYKDHQAVRLAQELTNRRFTYDAPPAFIAHLGPLPELELAHEYSSYLIKRAGNRQRLEDFRQALQNLARESHFLAFFNQWDSYLATVITQHSEGFRPLLVTQWLEDFFGWSADQFHLIVTPSMFPAGGYGASVTTSSGQVIAYQIIREKGTSLTTPEFPIAISLEQLTLHELGHSFVNPSMEAYPRRAYFLRTLFRHVDKEMRGQAYGSITTFLNEQVLRSMEVIAAEELYGSEVANRVVQYHLERSFYLTEFVADHLRYYQENRDVFPTFREFVPYLYDILEGYQREHFTFLKRARAILPF